jgi:hypothetical protein
VLRERFPAECFERIFAVIVLGCGALEPLKKLVHRKGMGSGVWECDVASR